MKFIFLLLMGLSVFSFSQGTAVIGDGQPDAVPEEEEYFCKTSVFNICQAGVSQCLSKLSGSKDFVNGLSCANSYADCVANGWAACTEAIKKKDAS